MTHTIVCFGDSITRGQISANYVDLLKIRFSHEDWRFVNAGINNELAYNLLQRINKIIALKPDIVTILVGTNDILSSITPAKGIYLYVRKSLPRQPDFEWYCSNVVTILKRLKSETNAKIALVSIPLLGEVLASFSNQRVRKYNAALQEIAAQEDVTYLPLYERMASYVSTNGKREGRAYQGNLLMPVELSLRRIFLSEPYDSISRRKGFQLLTDGVHMNNQGAALIADEIEDYLKEIKLK